MGQDDPWLRFADFVSVVRLGAPGVGSWGELAHVGGFVWKFGTLGEGGERVEKKGSRHEGTQARSGDQAARERVRGLLHLIPCWRSDNFVPECVSAFCSFALPVRLARCCALASIFA